MVSRHYHGGESQERWVWFSGWWGIQASKSNSSSFHSKLTGLLTCFFVLILWILTVADKNSSGFPRNRRRWAKFPNICTNLSYIRFEYLLFFFTYFSSTCRLGSSRLFHIKALKAPISCAAGTKKICKSCHKLTLWMILQLIHHWAILQPSNLAKSPSWGTSWLETQ